MRLNVLIINGPNLNLLGKREKEIYGDISFTEFFERLKLDYADSCKISYFQSNIEGEIIDALQKSEGNFDGVVLNAGGYTHTSVAIADAIAAITVPVAEVHISNIFNREEFRQVSLIAKNCVGTISGFGLLSYSLAIEYFLKKHLEK
jgi:3-dehydroquinate dehydratase-2